MEDGDNDYLSVLSGSENFSEEQLKEFQSQLWVLWGRRAELYTTGDSSSIPVEIAEELFQSICYCIAEGQKHEIINKQSLVLTTIKAVNVQELFSKGLEEVGRQTKIGKKLLKKAVSGMLEINNEFYKGVATQAGYFFKKYDYYFLAHENPCIIDYPLCNPTKEKQGIEYINEYLSCFKIENDFCRYFKSDIIIDLLKVGWAKYTDSFMNIYEPVADNALALVLLEKNIFTLNVEEKDGMGVIKDLLSLSKEAAAEKLSNAVKELCRQLEINESYVMEYLNKTAMILMDKIEICQKTNSFNGIFYCRNSVGGGTESKLYYKDSDSMDDAALRDLMDEIGDCEATTEKIAIVEKNVHSLRDLTEVLNLCFWDNECVALFNSFDTTAIAILLRFVHQNQAASWQSETGWEKILLKYIDKMEESERVQVQQLAEKFM